MLVDCHGLVGLLSSGCNYRLMGMMPIGSDVLVYSNLSKKSLF